MNVLFLCIKIFVARIMDVSLGTFRTILTVKGKDLYAALVGFVEVTIWFIIVKEALNTGETGLFVVISYAGGFATGTFIGGKLSQKFISGNVSVQVITENRNKDLINAIRKHGYGVSVLNVMGKDNRRDKYMLFIEINKKQLRVLKELISNFDAKAFVVVNETQYVQNGFIK